MGYQEVGVMVVVNLEVLLGMNLDPENPLRKDLTVNWSALVNVDETRTMLTNAYSRTIVSKAEYSVVAVVVMVILAAISNVTSTVVGIAFASAFAVVRVRPYTKVNANASRNQIQPLSKVSSLSSLRTSNLPSTES